MDENIYNNKYRYLTELGRGGFGITFVAIDMNNNNKFVIKKLNKQRFKPRDITLAIETFIKEAATLKSFNHQSIPKFIEYFEQNGDHFIVQQFVEGQSIKDQLGDRDAYAEVEVIRFLEDVLQILIHVHHLDYVHCDIKPANIIKQANELFLVDFGATVRIAQQHVQTAPVSGTQYYMAPEQFGGRAIPSSDVYSLGVVAIQLLMGVKSLSKSNTTEAVIQFDPDTKRIIWHDRVQISSDLMEVIDKMIEPDPAKRYITAQDAYNAVRNIRIPFDPNTQSRDQSAKTTESPREPRASTVYVQRSVIPDNLVGQYRKGFPIQSLEEDFLIRKLPSFGDVIVLIGQKGAGKSTLLKTWFTKTSASLPPGINEIVFVDGHRLDFSRPRGFLFQPTLDQDLSIEGTQTVDNTLMQKCIVFVDGLEAALPNHADKLRVEFALLQSQNILVVSCLLETWLYSGAYLFDQAPPSVYHLLGFNQEQCSVLIKSHVEPNKATRIIDFLNSCPAMALLAATPVVLNAINKCFVENSEPIELYERCLKTIWNDELYFMYLHDNYYRSDETKQKNTFRAKREDTEEHSEYQLKVNNFNKGAMKWLQEMVIKYIQSPNKQDQSFTLVDVEEAEKVAQLTAEESKTLLAIFQNKGLITKGNGVHLHYTSSSLLEFALLKYWLNNFFDQQGLETILLTFWDHMNCRNALSMYLQRIQRAKMELSSKFRVLLESSSINREPENSDRSKGVLRSVMQIVVSSGLENDESLNQLLIEKMGFGDFAPKQAKKIWRLPLRQSNNATISSIQNYYACLSLAANFYTPKPLFSNLLRLNNFRINWEIARNQTAPKELLDELAALNHTATNLALASNPSLPFSIANRFSNSFPKSREFALAFARNPKLSNDFLLMIYNNYVSDSEVLIELAKNPNTPNEILAQLATKDFSAIRAALYLNPNITSELHEQLLQGLSGNEYEKTAANHHALVYELRNAYENSQEGDKIQRRLAANFKTPLDILNKLSQTKDLSLMIRLLNNPITSVAILERFSAVNNIDLKLLLAKHPNTSLQVLQSLSKEQHVGILANLSSNVSSPVDVLDRLAKSQDENILHLVAVNPSTPFEVVLARMSNLPHPD
jgi:serine/threonine protein kinase